MQNSARVAPATTIAPLVLGCDFTSSPSKRKPVVVAVGHATAASATLARIERFTSLADLGEWLGTPRAPWVGAFDLPFGLPRELVFTLGWPTEWRACMAHYAALSRSDIRDRFASFCHARPVGSKFAHRATDGPAGSSPSMKWVNPPVAYMLHSGMPLLLQADAHLPGLRNGNPNRVAVEAYPGLLAREAVGSAPYKSDDKAKQTPARLIGRKDILAAVESGLTICGQPMRLGLRLKLTHAQRDALVDDASGDSLDAALAMVQAAWAYKQHAGGHGCYGLPPFDPLEGWIVSA